MAYISKDDAKELKRMIDEAIAGGMATMDSLMEMAKPFYTFDKDALERQALRRAVTGIVKQDKDEDGVHVNIIVRMLGGQVVNLRSCTDKYAARAAMEQQRDILDNAAKSYRKAEAKYLEIEGQLSLFEDEAAE